MFTCLNVSFFRRPKWDDECRDYDKAFILAMDLVRTELIEVMEVSWRSYLIKSYLILSR